MRGRLSKRNVDSSIQEKSEKERNSEYRMQNREAGSEEDQERSKILDAGNHP